MKRFVLICVIFCAALGCARIAAAEQRVALVIGNDAYQAAPLRNPVNDARAVAKSLNQLGFNVLLKTNLSQRAMFEATRDFSARIKEGDVALFYYSGHGMQVRGRNFLIPVDADIRAEDEVPYLSFDVSQVLDKLETARSRVNVVILDACRNNPFIRTFRSGRVGLVQMDAPSGTLIAFSTAPGAEARDGDSDYGTYTRHLLAHMPTPDLPVEVMFRRVRESVTAETGDRQVPWESSSLKGDFYFARPIEKPTAVVPRAALAGEVIALGQPSSDRPSSFSVLSRTLKVGDSWTYQLNDARFNKLLATLTLEVNGGDVDGIRETLRVSGKPKPATDTFLEQHTDTLQSGVQRNLALEPRIFEHQLPGGVTLFEFAPFITAFTELKPGSHWQRITGANNVPDNEWRFSGKVVGKERIRVPAGDFEAIKVELEGQRGGNSSFIYSSGAAGNSVFATSQEYTAWYAPEIGRVVKYTRKTYQRGRSLINNEVSELASYNLK